MRTLRSCGECEGFTLRRPGSTADGDRPWSSASRAYEHAPCGGPHVGRRAAGWRKIIEEAQTVAAITVTRCRTWTETYDVSQSYGHGRARDAVILLRMETCPGIRGMAGHPVIRARRPRREPDRRWPAATRHGAADKPDGDPRQGESNRATSGVPMWVRRLVTTCVATRDNRSS